jgi:hypothetical protein
MRESGSAMADAKIVDEPGDKKKKAQICELCFCDVTEDDLMDNNVRRVVGTWAICAACACPTREAKAKPPTKEQGETAQSLKARRDKYYAELRRGRNQAAGVEATCNVSSLGHLLKERHPKTPVLTCSVVKEHAYLRAATAIAFHQVRTILKDSDCKPVFATAMAMGANLHSGSHWVCTQVDGENKAKVDRAMKKRSCCTCTNLLSCSHLIGSRNKQPAGRKLNDDLQAHVHGSSFGTDFPYDTSELDIRSQYKCTRCGHLASVFEECIVCLHGIDP